jgi:hypothetical protein
MAAQGDSERTGWWSTVPGIITAIAALITAITGLVIALNQTGIFQATLTPSSRKVPDTVYKTYSNPKYGYSVEYPTRLLSPTSSESSDDGQTFRSPDKTAMLRVLGRPVKRGTTIDTQFRDQQKSAEEHQRQITYKIQKDNWFIISGLEDDKIFYEKTIRTGDSDAELFLLYQERRSGLSNQIVEHISRSFTK